MGFTEIIMKIIFSLFIAMEMELLLSIGGFIDYELMIPCNEAYIPEHCNFPNITLSSLETVEDFDRCAPAMLPILPRNYFWAAAGRKITYKRNFQDFKRLQIIPRDLRDVSKPDLTTFVLGSRISTPIGISPTAAQKLAHPEGEIATARAAAKSGTLMILSSFAMYALEAVYAAAINVSPSAVLWMQTYIFPNRQWTLQLIRRAEKAGYKALVVTVDSPVDAEITCESRISTDNLSYPNLPSGKYDPPILDSSLTFKDIAWLQRNTRLPIVAKGILTGRDALRAVQAGATAILVSNHGGRQMDTAPSTIEALPGVVRAVQSIYPPVEVYMDGGVRNGWDVYKALARGAKAVLIGRPVVWGLAVGGEDGVNKVLSILKKEFNETMRLAGFSKPSEIASDTVSIEPAR